MRRQFSWVALMGAAFVCGLVQAPGEAAEAGGNAVQETSRPAADTAQLWVVSSQRLPVPRLAIEVSFKSGYEADELVPFECVLTSRNRIDGAAIHFRASNARGELMATGKQTLDIYEGLNSCHFDWDAVALPAGRYTARFEVQHGSLEERPAFEIVFKKVTTAQLDADLEALGKRIESLREQLSALEKDGLALPHIDVRMAIAEDFAGRARQECLQGNWRRTDALLDYLQKTADAIHVGVVFGSVAPELREPIPETDLGAMEVRDGAFYSGDRPVFLFGRVLEEPTPETITLLRRYGLNLAVFAISPADTLASPTDTNAFQARFDPVFREAEAQDVSLAVQLAPHQLGAWALDARPEITNTGFVDLTHDAARDLFERHAQAVAPYLAEQKMVNSVSIAANPRFKFDGEEVRKAFIEEIRVRYPDRQALNQIWRTANLPDYDAITIWGDYPDYSYQNQHPYQFEWQTFHHRLATDYLTWMVKSVSERAAGVPLLAMLPDTAFEFGETRHGVDREAVANLMDISGCTASMRADDPYYSFSYPQQSAFYTLLRSFAPAKPVFNLEDHIAPGEGMASPLMYAYIRSVLWEAVMSGLNATALAPDTGIFDQPEALEAFAIACLDINRLAPLIHAFQQAPPDIVILFSRSSKIFDDGDPHLLSARYAYEGCSFAGYKIRFVTEAQCVQQRLEDVKLLVIPQTPAVDDATFEVLKEYVDRGGTVVRVGTPIPYNAYGHSRHDVIRNTPQTVLVRGINLPTEYLHAVDAAIAQGSLPQTPRPVNADGYPLEGVRTCVIEYAGDQYLYVVNLRKTAILCHLVGNLHTGRDLIAGRAVTFPRVLQPLDPMLIRLEQLAAGQAVVSSATPIAPEFKWWQTTAKRRARKQAKENAGT